MAKTKSAFFCQECGAQSPKWIGKCPSCGKWNTYVEEIISTDKVAAYQRDPSEKKKALSPVRLGDEVSETTERIQIADNEFNRVLGGGVMPGSVILVGGEPGIGKSTLMLQIAANYPESGVLYVSGEESIHQIQSRAKRIGLKADECYLLADTFTPDIIKISKKLNPQLLIIDSIQTMRTDRVESGAGSVSQIRESTAEIISFAKNRNIPVFLIGHITKDGSLAGPKVLEHMVDVVLYFEGDRNNIYRILRTVKNRYGSTSEMGIYEMQQDGLISVENPSELLLSGRAENLSGIAVGATMEGLRPILIEAQALVTKAVYGTPQRSVNGFDMRRLNMLLAVLEKRCGLRLGMQDVFLNIAGGIRVDDPAIDFAVIASLISSYEDIQIPVEWCFAGEVGLAGEVRAIPKIEQRIAEAAKLGFNKIFVSANIKSIPKSIKGIDIIKINKVQTFHEYFIK
ncbi:MAG: DNA repair protein RadA [Chitinophagaceae bacterium]|nr:MAG: DNA repair protein RadA [Chitinophagaceae bacterium]